MLTSPADLNGACLAVPPGLLLPSGGAARLAADTAALGRRERHYGPPRGAERGNAVKDRLAEQGNGVTDPGRSQRRR